MVWPIPFHGSLPVTTGAYALWCWLTPTQLRTLWQQLSRPPARRSRCLLALDAIRVLPGHDRTGPLATLAVPRALPAREWNTLIQAAVRGGDCSARVERARVERAARMGYWHIRLDDPALSTNLSSIETLAGYRLAAVETPDEAAAVSVDMARWIGRVGLRGMLGALIDPASAPWWHQMTGALWRVWMEIPHDPRVGLAMAHAIRTAPEGWSRQFTADDWTALLQYPSAAVREAAIAATATFSQPGAVARRPVRGQ